MNMEKGQTAMDIKKKMAETILKAIESRGKVNIKNLKANLIIQSGFSDEFVLKIFKTLEEADLIFIDESEGTARMSTKELKKRGSENV